MKGLLCAIPLFVIACGQAPEIAHEEAREQSRRQEVRLSEDAVRAAGIEMIPVAREAFHPHVVASGIIRPVAQKSVTVRSLVGGRLVQVLADVGERVGTGQTLCTIEGSEVTAALARYRTAAAREEAARRALERGEKLLDMKGLSTAEVDQRRSDAESAAAEAQAARQDLVRLGLDPTSTAIGEGSRTEFPVVAPMAGVVLSKSVSAGLLIQREATLFEIADLSQVWAMVDVYEKDLGEIREQGEVEIRTDAYKETVFMGRIALIEPTLDEASRTAHVRVVLDNRSGKLRPGLFVTAAVPLRSATEAEATAVPGDAVQKISGLPAVFVETGLGRFELRPVETGREAHGMVEIRHGLKNGERVVAKGAFVLKSELLKGSIAGEEH
ncbi:MAG: efflux RND transporter periplasmic adaptor subunit [Gammaproteobacteria bacterium]